jgi:hypothetical protein
VLGVDVPDILLSKWQCNATLRFAEGDVNHI